MASLWCDISLCYMPTLFRLKIQYLWLIFSIRLNFHKMKPKQEKNIFNINITFSRFHFKIEISNKKYHVPYLALNAINIPKWPIWTSQLFYCFCIDTIEFFAAPNFFRLQIKDLNLSLFKHVIFGIASYIIDNKD